MKRQYFGLDAQFGFLSSLGKTTLRAEGLIGTQPGIAGAVKARTTVPDRRIYRRTPCLSVLSLVTFSI